MRQMNTQFHVGRTALLEEMAALQSMEQGSLKVEYREQPSGTKSGPYFKHQVWREGANVSQRVCPDDAPALAPANPKRQKFEAQAADLIKLNVAHTRQNHFPDSLKKRFCLPCRPRRGNLPDNGPLLLRGAHRRGGAKTGSAGPRRPVQTSRRDHRMPPSRFIVHTTCLIPSTTTSARPTISTPPSWRTNSP